MPGIFDDAPIGIPCGHCGRANPSTLGWVKTHDTFICECGTPIKLDTTDLERGDAEINEAHDRLDRTVKRLSTNDKG